ncbi:MAG: DUF4037 domain-containing protein [Desulfovibrio sp.]|jgi:hypothetical protein
MAKGLDIAKLFFEDSLPLLNSRMPGVMECAAAGLAGEGSECLGFDDETSRDHDWGPAFCLWIPGDVLRAESTRIEQALALLPDAFMGYPTRMRPEARMGRVGPMSVEGFYSRFLGMPRAPQAWQEWRSIPEHHLCSCTSGAVFMDNTGQFSGIRKALLQYYPEDLRRKKIAARCMIMAQTGQYNLPRSLSRGELVPAMLAAARFAEAALSLVHLLNRRFMPFYKWAARSAAGLPVLGQEAVRTVETLAHTSWGIPAQASHAVQEIEGLCAGAAQELRREGLAQAEGDWLWTIGPSVQMGVRDPEIRRLNVMED